MDSDITEARETVANASAGIDKIYQELRSLINTVAKSEVRTHGHLSSPRTS